jgi:hypothetical protein
LGKGENYVTRSFVICSLLAAMYSKHDTARKRYWIHGETRNTYIIVV